MTIQKNLGSYRELGKQLEKLEKDYKSYYLLDNIEKRRKSNIRYVDLFVNNKCNLKCKHCYVSYNNEDNDLNIEEFKKIISDLKDYGARVFGIVGKEPLLTWDKTREILYFLKEKREEDSGLRFGMVTNATFLDEQKAKELKKINPDYIDISIDGAKKENDYIRGKGIYDKIIKGIRTLDNDLKNKIVISFTLTKKNQNSFLQLVRDLQKENIKKFSVSPYLTIIKNDPLELSNEEYINFVNNVLKESKQIKSKIDIYIKNDYTSKKYQRALIKKGIIDLDNLLIDENLALWNIKKVNKNRVLFNVQTWDVKYWYAIRISHDGFVSDCFSMLSKNYTELAIGNVRQKSIKEILKHYMGQSKRFKYVWTEQSI